MRQQPFAWFIKLVCDDLALKGTLVGDTYLLDAALIRNPAKVSRGLQTLANWQRSTIWLMIPGTHPGTYVSHTRFVPEHGEPEAQPEVDLNVDSVAVKGVL
jgi:hypothetical protein